MGDWRESEQDPGCPRVAVLGQPFPGSLTPRFTPEKRGVSPSPSWMLGLSKWMWWLWSSGGCSLSPPPTAQVRSCPQGTP